MIRMMQKLYKIIPRFYQAVETDNYPSLHSDLTGGNAI